MVNSTPRRKGGLLGGLVFLAFGIVFLLFNLGIIVDLRSFVSQYWPSLLILMGIAKIAEYLWGTGSRLLRFGEFLLILFVICFGFFASRFPFQVTLPVGNRHVRVSEYYGDSFTFSEEKTQTVGPSPSIVLRNSQGNVVLTSGIDGQIKTRVRKTIYARSEDQARQMAERISLVVEPDGDDWRIETTRSQLPPHEARVETSFEISVPQRVTTRIDNTNGDVRLEGLTGDQVLSTSYGLLSLRRIEGNVEGTNKYGESRIIGVVGNLRLNSLYGKAWVEEVSGDLTLDNSYSPVDVYKIGGKTLITNSYSTVSAHDLKMAAEITAPGSRITVDGVEGNLKVRSSHKEVVIDNVTGMIELEQEYGSVRASNVGGDLVAVCNYSSVSGSRIKGAIKLRGNNSDIDLEEIRGDADIQNKFKPVNVIDFLGSVSIVNENGAVTLATSTSPTKPITVVTSYEELVVSLPADSNFRLETTTRAGRLDCQFPGLETGTAPGDARFVRGNVGQNGPLVKLENQYSNISVKRSSRSR